MYICKYCGKQFEKGYQLGTHVNMCIKNPNSRPNKLIKKNIEVIQFCPKCGKEFIQYVPENLYLKQKYKKFCSPKCSNSRILTSEIKEKINKSLKETNIKCINSVKTCKKQNDVELTCKCCGKEFLYYRPISFCSDDCRLKGYKLTCEYCGKEFYGKKKYIRFCSRTCVDKASHNKYVESGKHSATSQGNKRRSKSEMLFCSLCENYFEHVTHNDPIFNGWDADVLIWDKKIAILWNGIWHYKKITKKHSVEQVQNRDKIKYEEIKKLGWKVYIIKDLGKFNENFVKEQFDIFIKFYNDL